MQFGRVVCLILNSLVFTLGIEMTGLTSLDMCFSDLMFCCIY